MAETKTHTPLPWSTPIWSGSDEFNAKADALGIDRVPAVTNDGQRFIMAADHRVALVDCITEHKRGKGYLTECAERDANAALIVRAVNSHAELVAALEDCRTVLTEMCADKDYPNIMGVVSAALERAKGE